MDERTGESSSRQTRCAARRMVDEMVSGSAKMGARLSLGRISAVSRPYLGYISAASRLHLQVSGSGKMVLLHKLLPKLRAEGRKVLIFSQFVKQPD